MTETKNGLPIIYFDAQAAWEAWLDEHHAASEGVWLKLAKKAANLPTVSYAEAVESAICYGWIDGQKASFDDAFWLQRFTPRRPKSRWSKLNVKKALDLIEAGRMQPAGLREVERARADGRWEAAYASQRTMTVPEDFQAELDKNPRARAFFDTLSSANRYAILYRIHEAKRATTRARRIEGFIAMLNDGKTLY